MEKKRYYRDLCLVLALTVVVLLVLGNRTAAFGQSVIKLTFAHHAPPAPHLAGQAYANWAQRIEKATNDRVKMLIYPASSLIAQKDQYEAMTGGIADIGQLDMVFNPKQFPLNSVLIEPPGLAFPNSAVRNRVWRDLWAKFPEMQAELKGVKALFMYDSPINSLQFVQKKAVRTPGDMKGMRVASGALLFPILRAWGAVEVDIPFSERYMALDKGAVDGSFCPVAYSGGFRLYEVTKSTTLNVGAIPTMSTFFVVNEKIWNRLPPDIQKVFMDNSDYGMTEIDKAFALDEQHGLDLAKKAGHIVIKTTPEEYELWTKPLLPLQDKWVAVREAKGLPARAVMEETKRLLAKYK